MTTHDYPTISVLGRDLTSEHVLVGESGGLCAIYENEESSAMPGLRAIHTEHGPLYLDPDSEYEVYGEPDDEPDEVIKSTTIRCDVVIPGDYAVPVYTYDLDHEEEVLVELDDDGNPTGKKIPSSEVPPSDWPDYEGEPIYTASVSEYGTAEDVKTTLTIEVPNAVTMDEAEALIERAIVKMNSLDGRSGGLGIRWTGTPRLTTK